MIDNIDDVCAAVEIELVGTTLSGELRNSTRKQVLAVLRAVGSIDSMDTPLPCDVHINHIRFSKGVPLRTLVNAATRWQAEAQAAYLRQHPVGDIEDGFIRDNYDS